MIHILYILHEIYSSYDAKNVCEENKETNRNYTVCSLICLLRIMRLPKAIERKKMKKSNGNAEIIVITSRCQFEPNLILQRLLLQRK